MILVRTTTILIAMALVACGSSSKGGGSSSSLELTGNLAGARGVVADGFALPLSGTSSGGTIEMLIDGELVGESAVDQGEFLIELKSFGATEGSKTLTLRLKDESAEVTATINKSIAELDAQAVAYLEKHGVRQIGSYSNLKSGRLLRWPDGPIRVAVEESSYTELTSASLTRMAEWTGLDLGADATGAIKLRTHEKPQSYANDYTVRDSRTFEAAALKLGNEVVTADNVTRLLLHGLGMAPLEPGSEEFGGSVVDKNFASHVGLYPFQQQAMRTLYTYPPGQTAVLPASKLGIRVAEVGNGALGLVSEDAVLHLTLDVRNAEKVEVIADGQIVHELATPTSGLYPIFLDDFGAPGKKDLTIKAISSQGEAVTTLAIDHDPDKVLEMARSYAKKNMVFTTANRTIRWPGTTLKIKSHYSDADAALAKAVAFLNQMLSVKFEVVTSETADVHLHKDTEIDGKSNGGQSRSATTFEMSSGLVRIEPIHAREAGVIAHELVHVVGHLAHIAESDTTNFDSLMTPVVSTDVLFPYQQLGINLIYRNPPGTTFDDLE